MLSCAISCYGIFGLLLLFSLLWWLLMWERDLSCSICWACNHLSILVFGRLWCSYSLICFRTLKFWDTVRFNWDLSMYSQSKHLRGLCCLIDLQRCLFTPVVYAIFLQSLQSHVRDGHWHGLRHTTLTTTLCCNMYIKCSRSKVQWTIFI